MLTQRRSNWVAGLLVAVLGLAGCAAPGSLPSAAVPSPSAAWPPLSISNGTTIVVTLVVNGAVLVTVAPGVQLDPITAPLPPRPWAIEARSPSGRVLSSMTVKATDYIDRYDGDGVRADLSCGRLDIWSGPPMLGPAFVPGPSGDCQ